MTELQIFYMSPIGRMGSSKHTATGRVDKLNLKFLECESSIKKSKFSELRIPRGMQV